MKSEEVFRLFSVRSYQRGVHSMEESGIQVHLNLDPMVYIKEPIHTLQGISLSLCI
jgi:hypothetical protein